MTGNERKLLSQNERDERWLRDFAPGEPSLPSREHLKLRVQIAGGEQWLEGFGSPKPSAECVANVKQAIRREVRSTRRRIPFPVIAGHPMVGTMASLAAAAVVVFGVFLGLRLPVVEQVGSTSVEDLVYVMGLASAQDDWGLTQLAEEVEALESALADAFEPSSYDDVLDEMDTDTYELLNELESSWDAPARSPA